MRSNDDTPTEAVPQTRVPLAPDVRAARDASPAARPFAAGVTTEQAPAPAELAGMLLPTEHVTFASSPHPIVFVRPVVQLIGIAIVLAVALSWETHPVVRGHHVTVPLLTGLARTAALTVAGLLALRELVSIAGRAFRFFAFRLVSTNRRVFAVEGVLGRRVTPIGNSALAGATMSQGPIGRMLGYGNLVLPSSLGTMRDMREPVRMYREFEAVANGVDGDQWTPAIRQTLIP